MTSTNLVFPFKEPSQDDIRQEAIKWSIGNSRYEIYTIILKQFDVDQLLPHCWSVISKINSIVGTENHKVQSMYRVFPRTLSTVLLNVWKRIIANTPADQVAETEEHFGNRIRDLVAAHASEDDRHDLVQQLRTARKPRDLPVQTFHYRLEELNQYVDWLPGEAIPLTESQLKQAFYDAMPQSWRDRYRQAGRTHLTETDAQVLYYFRSQETLAIRKQTVSNRARRCPARSVPRDRFSAVPIAACGRGFVRRPKRRSSSPRD